MDILKDHVVFLTGASGFVGTTIALKLLLSTSISKLYVLVRGGESALFSKWAKNVPPALLADARNTERLIILSGDMTQPSLGLEKDSVGRLAGEVTIVIHSASSINLGRNLAKVLPLTLDPTVRLADLAQTFSHLKKFVFISTAFANAELRLTAEDAETRVEEKLYPIPPAHNDALVDRLGDFDLRQAQQFPWVYGYLKNLTEKVLVEKFSEMSYPDALEAELPEQLLIVRPAVVGPALEIPVPGFEVTGSAPTTTVFAGLVLQLGRQVLLASTLTDPFLRANVSEIPVDIIANQVIMNLAFNTKGVVHCAPRRDALVKTTDLLIEANRWRRLWKLTLKIKKLDWLDKRQTPVLRLATTLGCSYDFLTDRTELLPERMSGELQRQFPMICGRDEIDKMLKIARTSRGPHIKEMMGQLAAYQGIPSMLTPLTSLVVRKTAHQKKMPHKKSRKSMDSVDEKYSIV